MNITLTSHPPSTTVALDLQNRTPRTALADRIAMRIGLALLVWGTRPAAPLGPDVSGYRPHPSEAARREIDRALATHQRPFPPIAR
ncbi:hypothetical protein GCM10010922_20930 [Microbacterium sorbitolivorans]|uniref:Uncharacterized protein n=1 Tax=Microbacterium sorbitolivorans TaxID=1867410 RepID=A0A367Y7L8_9MICO|nr:hypothetical protein [Microbacterium sorbitolivorans]RCK61863.1 hypothetical protein DTO57_04415 [Microbacterium sorbitolivorans]GGF45044.1 hypothetical protein GCM10010922_20930 [Microbacterium sorbitolivorans]